MDKAYIISCALTGTLSFLFGIFVYLKNRSSNVNKICMLLNLSVSLWSWFIFGRDLSIEKSTALFCVRMIYVGAILIPTFFLHFVSAVIKKINTKLILSVYFLTCLFLISDATPLFIHAFTIGWHIDARFNGQNHAGFQ